MAEEGPSETDVGDETAESTVGTTEGETTEAETTEAEVTEAEATEPESTPGTTEAEDLAGGAANEVTAEEEKKETAVDEVSTKIETVTELEKPAGTGRTSEGGGGTVKKEAAPVTGQIDDETLKQLEQTEKEANEVAEIVRQLKLRLGELIQKDRMTETEAQELKEKNLELRKQMEIFEEKTKLLRDLITNLDVLKSMKTRIPQEKHEEDVLPRVILCGIEQDYVPKIVVCHQKKTKSRCISSQRIATPGPSGLLDSSPSGPSQNEDLEKLKLMLEEDISNKDKVLDELHAKLASLQNEIQLVSTENTHLNERIKRIQDSQKKPCEPKKMCPALMVAKLQEYSDYTRKLEKKLVDMDKEFRTVVKDICAIQKQRTCPPQKEKTAERSYSCQKPC